MENTFKILFVEDTPTDLELVKRSLKKSEINFIDHVVEEKEDFENALISFVPDIIISDYSLPKFNGMQALAIRQQKAPMIPFLLVTGSNNEEIAVESMKAGADDYILKDNLTRLGQAVNAAITKHKNLQLKKKAEEALSESEELFRTAFENAAIGVCMMDTNLQFIKTNKTFCSITGYDPDDLYKLTFKNLAIADDLESNQAIFSDLEWGNNSSYISEMRLLHKNGAIIWVNIFSGKVYSPANSINYYISYIQDITNKKKAEQELIVAKEKAEESDRLKTAFLANMSHEIRTPMNGIMGFAELLKNSDLSDANREKFINIIELSGKRMLSTLNDLIEISSIEAGVVTVTETDTNVNEMLRFLYNFYELQSREKGLNLSLNMPLPDEAATIMTDKDKLDRILINLVGNAIKFTHKGFVEFGYKITANAIEFYVTDTGIGIQPDKQGIIFKRFVQGDLRLTRGYEGSGLGLSISKEYIEMLGGTIQVESQEGIGSTFRFTIPRKESRKAKPLVSSSPAENIHNLLKDKKILIAEDDEINYLFLADVLEPLCKSIERATNGIETVNTCWADKNIDIVLMDIKMDGMDGYEATRQIREFNQDVIIIAQSAHALATERERAFQAGCNDYLSKPFEIKSLIQIITKHLNNTPPK